MRNDLIQWIRRPASARLPGVAAAAAVDVDEWPAHDPQLSPRDEVIFLLHTAAEVEHSLLVQYLYAAWSIPRDARDLPAAWRRTIIQIAKQEMGHLLTVGNVLRGLRAPLNFDREHFPFRPVLYPFPFVLEPLSKGSLAKYVAAEMPKDSGLSARDLETLRQDAKMDNDAEMVNRVGELYAHIIQAITDNLKDEDFSAASLPYQGTGEDWDGGDGMIVQTAGSRTEALAALHAVAVQGEGMEGGTPEQLADSHFSKFLTIYRAWTDGAGITPFPRNPSTARVPVTPAPEAKDDGHITHAVSRPMAQLANLFYRGLLYDVAHHLSIPAAGENGSIRSQLAEWAIEEMRELSGLVAAFRNLPLKEGGNAVTAPAGLPMELPYTLALPQESEGAWLTQQDLATDNGLLIATCRKALAAATDLTGEAKSAVETVLAAREKRVTGRLAIIKQRLQSSGGGGPSAMIQELRIFPALAIARFGSSAEPLENYENGAPGPDGYRTITPAETLRVDAATGEITKAETPGAVRFRDANGAIKPVCPFLEVWARFTEGGNFEPLTSAQLRAAGLTPESLRWTVRVANGKAARRTGDSGDRITAKVGPFSDHAVQKLVGTGRNLKPGKTIQFGTVRYLSPNAEFPEIRLRFTPGAGRVYGPTAGDANTVDDVYNAAAGRWPGFSDGSPPDNTPPSTEPAGIYASDSDGRSRGYVDDSCDGVVEVELASGESTPPLRAFARVTVGPPAFAPDSRPVRTLADELEQMALGPVVEGVIPNDAARDIIRRAFETMRLMNTAAMNAGGMARHDQLTGRAYEPIFPPGRAAYPNVTETHRQILDDLKGLDAAPGSPERSQATAALKRMVEMLRSPDSVGDLASASRRHMPGLMRGSDSRHLALTRRQIDTVQKALVQAQGSAPAPAPAPPGPGPGPAPAPLTPEEEMLAVINAFRNFAPRHSGVPADGGTLAALFADPPRLLQHLKTKTAQTNEPPGIMGQPLVVPGDPAKSAFFQIINDPNHPMSSRFAQTIAGTGKTGVEIVRGWILSLTVPRAMT